MSPEASRPEHGVEETDDDATVDLLFDSLQACSAAQELIESGGIVNMHLKFEEGG